jgi:hypothetical protein
MDVDCIHYKKLDGRCGLGCCTCNHKRSLTCSFEKPGQVKEKSKKKEKAE